jgi:hypothetical protein
VLFAKKIPEPQFNLRGGIKMKVIGENRGGYICEVGHTELAWYLSQYYKDLKRLTVGQEINLAKGHDYRDDILEALSQHKEFVKSHEKIIKGINEGITFVCAEVKDG